MCVEISTSKADSEEDENEGEPTTSEKAQLEATRADENEPRIEDVPLVNTTTSALQEEEKVDPREENKEDCNPEEEKNFHV